MNHRSGLLLPAARTLRYHIPRHAWHAKHAATLALIGRPQRGQRFSLENLKVYDRSRSVESVAGAAHGRDVGHSAVIAAACGTVDAQAGDLQSFGTTNAQLSSILEAPDSDVFSDGPFTSTEQVARVLKSSLSSGVSESEAQLEKRRAAFGRNQLPSRGKVSFLQLVGSALNDFTVMVLVISGFLSLILDAAFGKGSNDWIEGMAILCAVAVVVLVTAVNDYQKERQFRELSALAESCQVTVLREGREKEISSTDLVVGDVLLFDSGDLLAADGLIFVGDHIRVDESHLTGETDDVTKDPKQAPAMMSGSKILEGNGRMLITAVGLNSQQGQIFGSLSAKSNDSNLREETPLEQKLDRLASKIGRFGLGAAALSLAAMGGQFTYQYFGVEGQGWEWELLSTYLRFVVTSITIVVVAVPEGLPLAVTIALAFSVKRMLRDNNLVRRLSAAETMACCTTICTDKTGTLTQNEMTVSRLWIGEREYNNLLPAAESSQHSGQQGCHVSLGLEPQVESLLKDSIILNCTAALRRDLSSGEAVKIGSRTECALLELVDRMGADIDAIRANSTQLQALPFSSERKRMSTVTSQGHGANGTMCARMFTKGAAEIVLDLCTTGIAKDSSITALGHEEKARLLGRFQQDGHRMLALAYRDFSLPHQTDGIPDKMDADSLERELTLIALVGISDPLRPEVKTAIQQANRAGITVRMLTGDNAVTAASIARQCGILYQQPSRCMAPGATDYEQGQGGLAGADKESVMEGREFRQRVMYSDGRIQQQEFDAIWRQLRVLARCSPTDKLTIIRGLQAHPEEVVAMTGDGTNDAPALKAADVGFAMNNGTSVAKEASDILLLDSNFMSIIRAVLWGRNVYAGITKFLQFQLCVNIVAVVVACTGAIVSQESPLTAVQLLWINLIMDSLASLALATEAPTDNLLDLPPYSPSASLLSPVVLKGIVGQCAFQLAVMGAIVFHGDAIFQVPTAAEIGSDASLLHGTLVFNTFVCLQLFNQVNARRIRDETNVLAGILDNKLFLAIMGGELLLQVIIVQFGGEAFSTRPLNAAQWGGCIGIGALSLLVRSALLLLPPKPESHLTKHV